MLLLFSFSVTPKKYLHDWVANHTDFYSPHSADETSYSQAAYNCHCEDPVVSTPFIDASFDLNLPFLLVYKEIPSFTYHFLFSNTSGTKDSRGPPSIA
ncbi:MAG: hypothetical protein H7122_00600 [Chitinophagaceae bacterium]|nr:hypothetical protein [Chitinophagaceae bacterium]